MKISYFSINENNDKQNYLNLSSFTMECENTFHENIILEKLNKIENDKERNYKLFLLAIFILFSNLKKYKINNDELNIILSFQNNARTLGSLNGLTEEQINESTPLFLIVILKILKKEDFIKNSYNLFKHAINQNISPKDAIILCTYEELIEVENFNLNSDIVNKIISIFSKGIIDAEIIKHILNNRKEEEENKESFVTLLKKQLKDV
jgi:hypothetical protein